LTILLFGDSDTINCYFLINIVSPEIETKTTEQHWQKDLKNLILHLNNIPCHNSRQMTAEIEKSELSRIRHLAYRPDI
jgi:hypothetical protein